ncbi:hypothetical protein [Bacillus sp. EB01]|uniref:hypothetical protein n=1 Tax=Bacillus sp. EB01 TaxID=1347086 RepID=UPI0005C47DCF|nr:hypothetical protein [Bacillus sp. EB01]
MEDAKSIARNEAMNTDADPQSLVIVDIEDVPLAYLPGNPTRGCVKAVGDLAAFEKLELV